MSWEILQGDCIERMAEMEEASVDAIVTDPPYGIGFMGREWDVFAPAAIAAREEQRDRKTTEPTSDKYPDRVSQQSQGGGPAIQYDETHSGNQRFQAWCETWAREAFRVLKPGAHLLASCGPRTYHRLAAGVEDAGFEIRDKILYWGYGSGFPKSLAVGKANAGKRYRHRGDWNRLAESALNELGTALKPAFEPIVVARKPLIGTVRQNVLEHGTGGLNIGACRIGFDSDADRDSAKPGGRTTSKDGGDASTPDAGRSLDRQDFTPADNSSGRWPANVVLSHLEECESVGVKKVKVVGATAHQKHHGKGQILNPGEGHAEHAGYRDEDGTETVEAWSCAEGCPVAELDAQSGMLQSGSRAEGVRKGLGYNGANSDGGPAINGDRGTASRFFYVAKTSRAEKNAGLEGFEERACGVMQDDSYKWERDGKGNKIELNTRLANHHPTVKPINLMRWLVRLVTPPGGTCLDPFLGSGSTGCAAVLEGFNFIGIEREADYIEIAKARVAFWAQHEGREVEDILGLHTASQRQAKSHADQGQLGLLAEEAA